MARTKRSESEAKDMVRKELLWRKPFYFPFLSEEEIASIDGIEPSTDPSIPPPNACPFLDKLVPGILSYVEMLRQIGLHDANFYQRFD